MTATFLDHAEVEVLHAETEKVLAEARELYASINAATNNTPDAETEALNIKSETFDWSRIGAKLMGISNLNKAIKAQQSDPHGGKVLLDVEDALGIKRLVEGQKREIDRLNALVKSHCT